MIYPALSQESRSKDSSVPIHPLNLIGTLGLDVCCCCLIFIMTVIEKIIMILHTFTVYEHYEACLHEHTQIKIKLYFFNATDVITLSFEVIHGVSTYQSFEGKNIQDSL